jgi:Icc-related predicted phosphoesterase
MHLDIFEYKGVIFGGFEGSVRYKESQYAKMYTQEESIEMLKGYPYVDVMLCHAPPFGVNDEPGDVAHEGLKGINEYLKREHPKHLMHGHTYPTEEALVTSYEDTNIIYVQGGKIITI